MEFFLLHNTYLYSYLANIAMAAAVAAVGMCLLYWASLQDEYFGSVKSVCGILVLLAAGFLTGAATVMYTLGPQLVGK